MWLIAVAVSLLRTAIAIFVSIFMFVIYWLARVLLRRSEKDMQRIAWEAKHVRDTLCKWPHKFAVLLPARLRALRLYHRKEVKVLKAVEQVDDKYGAWVAYGAAHLAEMQQQLQARTDEVESLKRFIKHDEVEWVRTAILEGTVVKAWEQEVDSRTLAEHMEAELQQARETNTAQREVLADMAAQYLAKAKESAALAKRLRRMEDAFGVQADSYPDSPQSSRGAGAPGSNGPSPRSASLSSLQFNDRGSPSLSFAGGSLSPELQRSASGSPDVRRGSFGPEMCLRGLPTVLPRLRLPHLPSSQLLAHAPGGDGESPAHTPRSGRGTPRAAKMASPRGSRTSQAAGPAVVEGDVEATPGAGKPGPAEGERGEMAELRAMLQQTNARNQKLDADNKRLWEELRAMKMAMGVPVEAQGQGGERALREDGRKAQAAGIAVTFPQPLKASPAKQRSPASPVGASTGC